MKKWSEENGSMDDVPVPQLPDNTQIADPVKDDDNNDVVYDVNVMEL